MPDSRLHRLEESVAFGERATEELSAEVAALNHRIDQVARRLAAIESRLTRLADAVPDRASGGNHSDSTDDPPTGGTSLHEQ